jgi:Uma2 family endonuclease
MDDIAFAPSRHKLSAEEFHRMAEAGVFDKSDRIELIDGDLIDMAPIGQGHESLVASLNEAFFIACAGRVTIWPQSSIRIEPSSMPQPDLAILRRRADFYGTGNRPGPADILVLIEVAESSLHFDRTVKLPLYARAGIAEFWLVDVRRRILEAHRNPAGDIYAETTIHQRGDRVALALAPDIIVDLGIVFP